MYKNTFNIFYGIFRICIPYGSMVSNVKSYGTSESFSLKEKRDKK